MSLTLAHLVAFKQKVSCKVMVVGKMTKAQLRKSEAEAAARAEAEAEAAGEPVEEPPLDTSEHRAEVPGMEGSAVTPHPEMTAPPTEVAVVGGDIESYKETRTLEIDKNYTKVTTAVSCCSTSIVMIGGCHRTPSC